MRTFSLCNIFPLSRLRLYWILVISAKRLEELREDARQHLDSWSLESKLSNDIMDTLSAALKVVEAAKKIKSEAAFNAYWTELQVALAPFAEEKEK